ncbi:hypothetical protein WNZ15_06790 [Roseibium sp. AS2]|uniref:hypothetical protein n=1 Tax=Roseibium sp. AS2 TaxID=3135781 RepID=UPI003172CBA3
MNLSKSTSAARTGAAVRKAVNIAAQEIDLTIISYSDQDPPERSGRGHICMVKFNKE